MAEFNRDKPLSSPSSVTDIIENIGDKEYPGGSRTVVQALKLIADGKLGDISPTAIAEKLGISNGGGNMLIKKLLKRGQLTVDQETQQPILPATAQQSAQKAVARLYAKEVLGLLGEMSKHSAETRRVIVEEVFSTLATDEYAQREQEETGVAVGFHNPDYLEHVKEKAGELVQACRQMLGEFTETLNRKVNQ